MRVPLFTPLGALIAGAGLAAAQPPAPGTLPPTPVTDTAPAAPPAKPADTPAGPDPGTVLPAPTPTTPAPLPPGPPMQAGSPAPNSPVAAWQALPPGWTPGAPVSDLAYWYNVPYHGPQAWGGVEYLLWWVSPGPLPARLVNTNIVPADLANSVASGGIFDPNTRGLLGAERINFRTFSGVRGTVGRWMDCGQDLGFELNAFYLGEQQRNFSYLGGFGANAQPSLTVPFNSVGGAFTGETAATIAGPFAGVAELGAINLRMTSQLWGGDADGLLNWCKGEFWRVDFVGGFKYLSLRENLDFQTNVITAPGGSTIDHFDIENNFYGGELGGRTSIQMESLGFDLTAKVALGDSARTQTTSGTSIIPTNLGGGVAPGGLFAQSSNIGRRTTDKFAVVPQVKGAISYAWNCHVKTSVGYDFLYWSNVLRPGDQIDRNINTNLVPAFGGAAGGAGFPAPTRMANESWFYAHGVSFGLELTW